MVPDGSGAMRMFPPRYYSNLWPEFISLMVGYIMVMDSNNNWRWFIFNGLCWSWSDIGKTFWPSEIRKDSCIFPCLCSYRDTAQSKKNAADSPEEGWDEQHFRYCRVVLSTWDKLTITLHKYFKIIGTFCKCDKWTPKCSCYCRNLWEFSKICKFSMTQRCLLRCPESNKVFPLNE